MAGRGTNQKAGGNVRSALSEERTSHPRKNVKKPPHGGLGIQSGSCACESCCKSNEEHPYQRVSDCRKTSVAFKTAKQISAAENEKAEINESYCEHYCCQNDKSHPGVFSLNINELGEERDIEQQRLWIQQRN